MKALIVGAITIWVFVLVPMICALSFDLEKATKASYSTFLTTLRNQAKDPRLVYYKIPMLPAPVKPPNYFLIELIAAQGKTITLALAKDDLYVCAYLDQYQGKYRAHFFPDAPSNAKTVLFKEAKDLRPQIKYESNYDSLESKAGPKRNVGLGITKLKSSIEDDVYGKELNVALEAKFLLIAIQMVSEAARFKYIENQVLANFPNGFTPDYKILSLENKWSKISKAFFNSKDGSISPPLVLKDAKNKDWKVTKVTDIDTDMSLLSYQTGKKTILTNMFSQISRFFWAIVTDRKSVV